MSILESSWRLFDFRNYARKNEKEKNKIEGINHKQSNERVVRRKIICIQL